VSRLSAYIAEAFEAIWRNRTRSLLTMLGMIIGTSSIIAILGTSKAASGGIQATLASLGDPGISLNVDFQQDDPNSAQIQYRDVRIIADATAGKVAHIEPAYQRNMTLRANKVKYATFGGSGSDYPTGSSLTLSSGRFIDANDMATGAHVCLMSGPLALRFFPDGPDAAVGQVLRAGNARCTIVGVYADVKAGFLTALGAGEFFVMPYPFFHEIFPGPVDALQYYAAPGVSAGDATDAIITVLHRLHGERAKYVSQDNVEALKQFNSVLGVVATGLTAIGGVAMLVAGIGIMNIMLVSVTERTREIGLRKSIGASRSDIMLQFLLESILLSVIGGGIGMALGLGVVLGAYKLIEPLVGPAPIPYLLIVTVAVGFSTFIGTVFGTYPALRASRMDPIAALRS
jgi:putative ABC transport system permease protein